VHDLKVNDGFDFTATGRTVPVRTITYFIGDHGPFQLKDAKEVLTPDEIKRRIQAEIDLLTSLQSFGNAS